MKDGSINVKQGDRISFGQFIGQVGNTGNSRGKNGGYHLHVETAIDGRLVDPQKFNEHLAALQGNSSTSNSDSSQNTRK